MSNFKGCYYMENKYGGKLPVSVIMQLGWVVILGSTIIPNHASKLNQELNNE